MIRNLTFPLTAFKSNKFAQFCSYRSFSVGQSADDLSKYLTTVAKITPPKETGLLLDVLTANGDEIVSPSLKQNLNPFLIPISRRSSDNSLLCYIRWPTQRDTMDLQLVRTTDVGVKLVALNTTHYCQRVASEMEFYSKPSASFVAAMLEKSDVKHTVHGYKVLLESGKFPVASENDLRLVLDRYLLSKIAAFPDSYERLANNFLTQGSEVSALVTCERMVELFSNWAHPMHFHSKTLSRCAGNRMREVKESAAASLGMPVWTLAESKEDLELAVKWAGYSSSTVVGKMHETRSNDPRTKQLEEGLDPKQIPLDQAAHLMDAVALGSIEGGWDAARPILAEKYRLGGYPEIADFIEN